MKTLNPKILAVAAVIAIAAVCPAYAKEMSKSIDMLMMIDTNSDGIVSKNEMMSMMKMDHNTMMGKSNMMMNKDGAMMSK